MTELTQDGNKKSTDTRPAGGRSGISVNTSSGNMSVIEFLKTRDGQPTQENLTRTLLPEGNEHVVMNIQDFSKLK